MNGKLLRISLAVVCTFASATLAFSQAQTAQTAQNRIPQPIVIGEQQANGAYVTTPTGMQTFTCSNPQQYATPDGSSQGWACYDQATGVWLLNAVPPAAAQAPAQAPPQAPAQAPAVQTAPQQPSVIYQQPPTVIYQQPAPAVVYAVPGYGYGAYPYGYGYPFYSPSVIWGTTAIRAAGGIFSAAIIGNRYSYRPFYGRPGRFGRRYVIYPDPWKAAVQRPPFFFPTSFLSLSGQYHNDEFRCGRRNVVGQNRIESAAYKRPVKGTNSRASSESLWK
jgi:hypothetical protein